MTSRAKRHKVNTPGTIGDLPSYDFTLEEKKNLLHAFKNNGFNLTYQMDSLKESLPGRTSHEISSLLQKYKLRAKKMQANQTASETEASSSATSRLKDSPLSQWSHYLSHLIPQHNRRGDVSEALISTLESYSLDETRETGDESENYSSIYQFLADCLRGKCPRELNSQNSLIILTLLKQTKFLLNYVGCDSERKFIQSLSKETSKSRKTTQDSNEDEDVTGAAGARESQSLESAANDEVENNSLEKDTCCSQSNLVDSSSESSRQETEEANDLLSQGTIERRLNQFVEICMDLPKVKKVKSCLNPLNVPISTVLEEGNSLLEAIEDAS